MRSKQFAATIALVLGGWLGSPALAETVAVGSSSLIGRLDYSDTFTLTGTDVNSATARVNGLAPGFDQPAGTNLNLEMAYQGNPTTTWYESHLRFSAGPDGVMGTQDDCAESGEPATFAYGLRSNYLMQVDAKLASDRFNFITSTTRSANIFDPNALSVFLRQVGVGAGSIALFNTAHGEAVTGLSTGVSDAGFHNFAINFNHVANALTVYVDQRSVGTVDLATFASGNYSLSGKNAAYVGVGGWNSLNTMDNFQIGVVPEPGTFISVATCFLTMLAYAWRKRR